MKIHLNRNFSVISLSILSLLVTTESGFALQALDDQTLGNETGQAAFYTNYIDPTAVGNITTSSSATPNVGFFSLGLQGTIALNTNINRLQLGCGGVNGASGCDIDLSQVRLMGASGDPDSDATLTNPFIQLAIANPKSLSTRHIVGMALGAQSAVGQLSIGQNPASSISVAGKPGGTAGGETGINSLSGSFQVATANLLIPVKITGTVLANGTGDLFVENQNDPSKPNYQPTSYQGYNALVEPQSGKLSGVFLQYVSGSRMTGLGLGSLMLDTSNVNGLAGLIGTAYAQIKPENLIDVHNLNVSSNAKQGLLLSLNSQDILWPQIGTAGVYSFPTTTQFVNSSTTAPAITPQSLMAQTGWWLSLPQANIGGTNSFLTTAEVPLNGLTNTLNALGSPGYAAPSVNLQQVPVLNCYGGYKFC